MKLLSSARPVLERLSRGRYFKRRLPADFGRTALYVSPDAALAYWKPGLCGFDERLLTLARERITAGAVVWDIGANVGAFTFAAAYRAGASGQVICVEPDKWLAGLIEKSAALNPQLNVAVLSAAVSSEPGIATFNIACRGRASNALAGFGRSQAGGARSKTLVATVSLDQLLQVSPPPKFVKIDVEGAECLVLRGASKILDSARPVIYCEVGLQQDSEFRAIMNAARYTIHGKWNVIATPREAG